MAAKDVLNAMVNAAPGQVDGLDNNLTNINAQISALQEQADAISTGILDVDATGLMVYLETIKLPEFQLIDPLASVYMGPNYNLINLTDWAILDSTANPLYEYLGVGWDDSTAIIQYITDWNFGYDYLTRELTSGATYGLLPQIATLGSAISILTNNRDKIEDSIDVFGRYI